MADSFNKFNSFVQNLAQANINLHSDALNVLLTDVAPIETNSIKSDITEIAPGAGYTAGGAQMTLSSDGETGGIYKLILNGPTFTASGGSIAQFRYGVLYDLANGYLIGWWDFGSEFNITSGNYFQVNADMTNGVLQIQ